MKTFYVILQNEVIFIEKLGGTMNIFSAIVYILWNSLLWYSEIQKHSANSGYWITTWYLVRMQNHVATLCTPYGILRAVS